ncbi:MAG: hypothetical protein IJ134_04450 [Bacilli bacterium]|nr:hypothetical protein [Bacilli bacterium]
MSEKMIYIDVINNIMPYVISHTNMYSLENKIDSSKLSNIHFSEKNNHYIIEVKDTSDRKLYFVANIDGIIEKIYESSLDGILLYTNTKQNSENSINDYNKNSKPELLDKNTFYKLLNDNDNNSKNININNMHVTPEQNERIKDIVKDFDINNREDALNKLDSVFDVLTEGMDKEEKEKLKNDINDNKTVSIQKEELLNNVKKVLLEWINSLRNLQDDMWVQNSRIYRAKLDYYLSFLIKDSTDSVSLKRYNYLPMIDEIIKEKNKEKLYKVIQELIAMELDY